MEFGVSMVAVAGKAQEYAKTGDTREAYLGMTDALAKLASEHGLKALEIVSMPPFDAKLLSDVSKEMGMLLAQFDVGCHLPFADPNIDSFHQEVRKIALKEIKDVIEAVSGMGVRRVVMHPGFRDIVYPELYYAFGQNSKAQVEEAVGEVVGFCKDRGVLLTVENMPSPDPFYTKPEEFAELVGMGAGITLDPAHAVFSGVDPVDFVNRFESGVSEVHLQDAIKEKHTEMLQLGTGNVDYASLLKALEGIGFRGPVILEMNSESAVENSVGLLRKAGYLK